MRTERIFFVVWNPQVGAPKYRHQTKEAAIKEETKLARENLNQDFIVLQAIGKAKIIEPSEWTEFDEVPF